MDLQQAIKYVMDEEAVLFLGAGFSYGGTNVSGGRNESWQRFVICNL